MGKSSPLTPTRETQRPKIGSGREKWEPEHDQIAQMLKAAGARQ